MITRAAVALAAGQPLKVMDVNLSIYTLRKDIFATNVEDFTLSNIVIYRILSRHKNDFQTFYLI